MEKTNKRRVGALLAGFCSAVLLFAGCGGGGGGTSSGGTGAQPPKVLTWNPPTSYSDGSPLNPQLDLDHFEIHVNTTGSFSIYDNPAALVSAVDPITQQLATSFDLSNLASFLSKGVPYYVALRAVDRTGVQSAFSPAVSYSF